MCEDQEELRTKIFSNDVDKVHLPCHFEWLIKQAQRSFNIQPSNCEVGCTRSDWAIGSEDHPISDILNPIP